MNIWHRYVSLLVIHELFMRLFVFPIHVSVHVDRAHNLHHCVQAARDPALVWSYRRKTRTSLRESGLSSPCASLLSSIFIFRLYRLCPDHPVTVGKRHWDYGVDQWENSHHDQPVSGRLEPSHQPPVNAPQWHRGPSGHGRLCQVWEGKLCAPQLQQHTLGPCWSRQWRVYQWTKLTQWLTKTKLTWCFIFRRLQYSSLCLFLCYMPQFQLLFSF